MYDWRDSLKGSIYVKALYTSFKEKSVFSKNTSLFSKVDFFESGYRHLANSDKNLQVILNHNVRIFVFFDFLALKT